MSQLPPTPTPTPAPAAVPVVQTGRGQQIARILIGVVMALGAIVEFVTVNQAEIQRAFPQVRWIGAALLAGGLVARLLQEVLAVFDIHVVKTVPGPKP